VFGLIFIEGEIVRLLHGVTQLVEYGVSDSTLLVSLVQIQVRIDINEDNRF
jgi:hypothetical protein